MMVQVMVMFWYLVVSKFVEVVQVYQRDPHSNPHLAVCTWTKKQYINALIIYVLNTQFENRLLTSKLGRNMCYSAVRVRQ